MNAKNSRLRKTFRMFSDFFRSIPTGMFILFASWEYHRHSFLMEIVNGCESINSTEINRIRNFDETSGFIVILLCLGCFLVNYANDKERMRRRKRECDELKKS